MAPSGKPASPAQVKTDRVLAALNHQEADRVPVGEFFWTHFVRRCREQFGPAFSPYHHWDLDLIVVNPNMDPHITGLQVLEKSDDRIVLRTGFGATIESRSDCPMPCFLKFETETYEQMEALVFDDPADERRYHKPIIDQINGVGDAINLELPSYVDRVNGVAGDFCVFGSVCEPHEMIWRIMGTDNVLLKLAEEPARMARFIERIGDFMVGIVHAQVRAAGGRLKGMYVWGDVAYDHGMFFSPAYWREVYQPQLKRICDAVHQHGLKTIYHGCGNARVIYDDLLAAGVDCYNPLEAKAGLDVVDLKRQYKGRWAFNGNIDVRVLATNDRAKVRKEVLRKLNAAKGGGYILQSDHSIPHNVNPDTYDYVIQLAREYGQYPLKLEEHEEAV